MLTSLTSFRRYHALHPVRLATGLILLLLAVGAFPGKASAQMDTASLASLTSYSATVPAFAGATCSGNTCRMKFPPVPAGKRLLVLYVSLNTFSPGSTTLGALLTNGVLNYAAADYRQVNLPGGIVAKNDNSGFGYDLNYVGPTLMYIESGYTPTFVYYGSVLTNDFAGQGTITGVLIPQ